MPVTLDPSGDTLLINGEKVILESDGVISYIEGIDVSDTDGSTYTGAVRSHYIRTNMNTTGSVNFPYEYGVTHTFNHTDRTVSLWFSNTADKMAIQYVANDLTPSGWHTFTPDVLGEIKLYAGKLVDIPQDWKVANGTNGTVDMSADFKTYGTTEVVYIQYVGGN